MNYFKTLPKLIVRDNQSTQVITNLLARSSIISSMLTDPLLFYSYDVQDSDTPEIIAHKYYDDMERFWIVLFANQILDPQWDWPMSGFVFNKYIENKYTPSELIEVHHYEKIITQTDNISGTVTVEKIVIDEDTYNDLSPSTNTYTLPSGTATIAITKKTVDNFEYEMTLNESKRNIKLLNKAYAGRLEEEFNKLMNT